ncbi:MAG: hypothetical protein H7X74_05720 [Methyloceanibacter sp.]|nr:hypothetical protein [Methyloceanibacter sp.]
MLKRDQDWSPGKVEAAFEGGDDNHIALGQKIPVYITYFTLRVNDDGSMSTFNDLYGHDARMNAALSGKGFVPDAWAQNEEMAAAQQWTPPPGRRGRRGSLSNDFTRALFGF